MKISVLVFLLVYCCCNINVSNMCCMCCKKRVFDDNKIYFKLSHPNAFLSSDVTPKQDGYNNIYNKQISKYAKINKKNQNVLLQIMYIVNSASAINDFNMFFEYIANGEYSKSTYFLVSKLNDDKCDSAHKYVAKLYLYYSIDLLNELLKIQNPVLIHDDKYNIQALQNILNDFKNKYMYLIKTNKCNNKIISNIDNYMIDDIGYAFLSRFKDIVYKSIYCKNTDDNEASNVILEFLNKVEFFHNDEDIKKMYIMLASVDM